MFKVPFLKELNGVNLPEQTSVIQQGVEFPTFQSFEFLL